MARTGYLIVIYQDINPSSSTYNQTREERTQDGENCPTSAAAHWIEDTSYCELTADGMLTGYEITVYRDVEPLSPTYNQTRQERELNPSECEADSTQPNWQNIGEPFCRQKVYMPGGLMGNDGNIVQQQQDMNEYSPTADEIREIETQDLEHCPLPNTEPVWDIISESCHTTIYQGQVVYDGTKDVVRVNTNQYSPTWNNNIPETTNIEDETNCPSASNYAAKYLTFEALEDGTFTFTAKPSNTVSYTIDGGQIWIPLASGVASPTVTAGNKIMWKGTCTTPGTTTQIMVSTLNDVGIGTFSSTGTFKAYGNIMSLVYGDNFVNSTTISDFHFATLFYQSKVVDIENLILPSTTLEQDCYAYMFANCNSLVNTPALPATTMVKLCYERMFQNCRNLTAPPQLPATTLAERCYSFMFASCRALTTAPVLPATTLASFCYENMFNGCTSLTTPPALPATTLAEACYFYMFSNCINLTTPPALPATTLTDSCYGFMFSGCESLTTTPTLPATTLANGCYFAMLNGTYLLPDCTNIDFTSQTVVASGGLMGLFYGTQVYDSDLRQILPIDSNNRYYLPVTTLAEACYDYMFYGCMNLTTAPQLPATTLAADCYRYMFAICMNLTTAPELPATTLAQECYGFMFQNCRNLNSITCLATNISAMWCTRQWVSGVAAIGTFTKASSMSSWTTGDNGIPSGWTVANQ